jgi:CrcB protein
MPEWMADIYGKVVEWKNPLAVVLGGATGALARYAVSHWAAQYHAIITFPWHTFGINILGSFALGLLVVWYRQQPQPIWWFLLGTGFCGGFTTFSTFSLELLMLLEKGRTGSATAYAAGSVAAGIAGVMLAMRISRG